MEPAPLLEVRDLRTRFQTRRGVLRAVDGVAFAVDRGETVAIVGESGSGKSVTAMSILRLFGRTDRASIEGAILLHGRDGGVRDLLTLPEPALRDVRGREIAVIFQDPSASLNPVFTIGEQIREAIRRHRPAEAARADAAAVELLRDVGIADPERRVAAYPHQLSGGMRQRVMIAIALACQPRLLIADEPTTALDVTIQAQIMRLLADLKAARGMGLLFITHDLALVGEIADRVVVMYAGQVVETGRTAEILARPRHPYTRALLECRPERHYRDEGEDERLLRPIAGAPPRPSEVAPGCRFAPRCPMAEARCTAAAIPLIELAPAGGRASRCIRWEDMP
ncbi:ABC transporter ATP-binding protein [Allostella vacuolata]|nr:ABC transporter ATP-binding protein [Stella vacuolata]